MSGITGSRRVVLHTTESQPDVTNPWSVADYMLDTAGNSSGYHLLMPLTDRYAPLQLRPADRAAGSLRNSGEAPNGVSPNKQGQILITVSAVGYAHAAPFTHDPGPWWPQVLAWLRSWQVPDVWLGPDPIPGLAPMPVELWQGPASGWLAHSTVPAIHNRSAHWDPGRVSPDVLWPDTTHEEDPVDRIVILCTNGDRQGWTYLLEGTTRAVGIKTQEAVDAYRGAGVPYVGLPAEDFDAALNGRTIV